MVWQLILLDKPQAVKERWQWLTVRVPCTHLVVRIQLRHTTSQNLSGPATTHANPE